MAGEAAFVDLLAGVIGEDEDFRFIAAASDVSGARAVTAFASLVRRAALGIKRSFPVRRLLPGVVNLLVAGLADLRT